MHYFLKPLFFFLFSLSPRLLRDLSDLSPVVVEKLRSITIFDFEPKRIRKDSLRALVFGVHFFSKINE